MRRAAFVFLALAMLGGIVFVPSGVRTEAVKMTHVSVESETTQTGFDLSFAMREGRSVDYARLMTQTVMLLFASGACFLGAAHDMKNPPRAKPYNFSPLDDSGKM
jgi:hypothetical protein